VGQGTTLHDGTLERPRVSGETIRQPTLSSTEDRYVRGIAAVRYIPAHHCKAATWSSKPWLPED
jgi:hypothetical protein